LVEGWGIVLLDQDSGKTVEAAHVRETVLLASVRRRPLGESCPLGLILAKGTSSGHPEIGRGAEMWTEEDMPVTT
jgi:hypothetical protein